jgi:hypothetical protein
VYKPIVTTSSFFGKVTRRLMNKKFKERSFAALAGLLVLGASAVAVVDKDQRSEYMNLASNVAVAYGGWVAGTQQSEKRSEK